MKDAAPVYPPIAVAARVQGDVIVEARVEPDGRVSHARVIKGIPLLAAGAVDAVMQWEFTPVVLDGAPVPALVTATLTFTLKF